MHGAPQIKNLLKKQVLNMEFTKRQIKIKKHGLGNTIPGSPCEK